MEYSLSLIIVYHSVVFLGGGRGGAFLVQHQSTLSVIERLMGESNYMYRRCRRRLRTICLPYISQYSHFPISFFVLFQFCKIALHASMDYYNKAAHV